VLPSTSSSGGGAVAHVHDVIAPLVRSSIAKLFMLDREEEQELHE